MIFQDTKERKFYHPGREPKVLFIVEDKVCFGLVTNFWKNGITISCDADIRLEQNDTIARLYFDSLSQDNIIEGMRVLHAVWDETTGTANIDIYAPNQKTERRFEEIFRILMERPEKSVAENYGEHKLPFFSGREHYSARALDARLEWARRLSGSALTDVADTILQPEALAGNIENFFGAVQIPIGLAGPVRVNGVYASGYIPVPIATTEGALVSSISRGARVCNLAGGIETQVIAQQMSRVPVFFCRDMYGAINLEKWLQKNMNKIIAKAESVSSVARIKQIVPVVFGDSVHLRFTYTTGDAAGQNMTTSCTWVACEWIEEQIRDLPAIKFVFYTIEGNMSGDKKVNYKSFIEGRGISVIASCYVPGPLLKEKLRITAKDFVRLMEAAEYSALQTGMIGSNINFANPIAGIFTATGQDIACVHESAVGIFKLREEDDGLFFTAHLPSLVIGTVGGGTKLPTQRECLELMGCYGAGKSFRLAEIIAATCLALDISTGAAVASNEFASAHERLGRNRPERHLSRSEITSEFFTSLLHDRNNHVVDFEEETLGSNASIVTHLTRQNNKRFTGLFKYRLKMETPAGFVDLPAVLKVKTADVEVIEMGIGLAKLSGEDRLPGLFESQAHILGFDHSHAREIAIYRQADPGILHFCPTIYGSITKEVQEVFAILMEDLSPLSHLDTVNAPGLWDRSSIEVVLEDLARMHAVYFERFPDIPAAFQINRHSREALVAAADFLGELTGYNRLRFPELVPEALAELYRTTLRDIGELQAEMQTFPMTMTHNDFNPRNICLRSHDAKTRPRLVVYDWELAAYQNPQHDLIEFLIYCLPEQAPISAFETYAEFYRTRLEAATARSFAPEPFMRMLYLNALDLAVIRFNLYLLAHNIAKFTYMERVYGNLRAFLLSGRERWGR